jgi:hypothetical protein
MGACFSLLHFGDSATDTCLYLRADAIVNIRSEGRFVIVATTTSESRWEFPSVEMARTDRNNLARVMWWRGVEREVVPVLLAVAVVVGMWRVVARKA